MPTKRGPAKVEEELPYSIELWAESAVLRVLARAFNAALAHAIFNAARNEHPEQRIALRHGERIIADSQGDER